MESRGVGRVKARWDPAASNRAPHRPSLRGVHLHPRGLSASAAQREEPGEVPWGLQDRAAPAAPVDPGGGGGGVLLATSCRPPALWVPAARRREDTGGLLLVLGVGTE